MNLNFNETQTMFRESLRRFFSTHYDFEKRQAFLRSEAGWSPSIWRALAQDMGALGASFDEDLGGLGFGHVETMIVMEEIGRALSLEPYLPTVVMCGGAFRIDGGAVARDAISSIVSGEGIYAFAVHERQVRNGVEEVALQARRCGDDFILNGEKTLVLAGPLADHVLVAARTAGEAGSADGLSLLLVNAPCAGLSVHNYRTIDGAPASNMRFDNVAVPASMLIGPENSAINIVEKVMDEATIAICAESTGAMRVMHASTVAFAKERHQFGKPLAEFQVLQHRLADMHIEIELAESATLYATLNMSASVSTRRRAVSAAKVLVNDACRFVGQSAIQIHGAIGTTDELPLSHYFKRLTAIEAMFGSADLHRRRYDRNQT